MAVFNGHLGQFVSLYRHFFIQREILFSERSGGKAAMPLEKGDEAGFAVKTHLKTDFFDAGIALQKQFPGKLNSGGENGVKQRVAKFMFEDPAELFHRKTAFFCDVFASDGTVFVAFNEVQRNRKARIGILLGLTGEYNLQVTERRIQNFGDSATDE